jgi:integrase
MTIHLTDRAVQALKPPTRNNKIRLTDRTVHQLKAPTDTKDRLVFDDKLPGLAVRVGANGRKGFLFQGRQRDGRQVRQPIGRFPAIDVARARNLAKAAAGRLASGADLLAEKAERRAKRTQRKADAGFTVSDLIAEWVAAPKKRGFAKREAYARAADQRLRRVLKPLLARPAASITTDELIAACDAVERPVARHAACVQIGTLFRWGRRRIGSNPALDLELPEQPPSRDRCLEGEEAQAVWKAAGSLNAPYGPFVQFLLGSCVRRGEAAGARWSELSDDFATWTIPAERMKAGRVHLVPLPAALRDLLRALPRFTHSDRVFTSNGRKSIGGFHGLKLKIDAALKAGGVTIAPWRFHDFRRSAVSWMAAEKIDITVADLLLAHGVSSLSSVGAIYQQHKWIDERREALGRWTAFLADAQA